MSDRRRTQRFDVGPPLKCDVMSMQNVVVERIDDDIVTIVSLTALEPRQHVVVHVTTSNGLQSHRANVLSSTPIAVGASVQFRVELHMLTASKRSPIS